MSNQIPGSLFTTAMAVMPHTDISRALDMELSLDVPSLDVYTNAEIFSFLHTCLRRRKDKHHYLK